MKLKSFVFAAGLLTLAAACDSSSKLAEQVQGQWAGNPEQILESDASVATVIETYTFNPSDTAKTGGDVNVAALVSVTGSISGVTGISQPLNMTVSGYASVQGSWDASSGNELTVRFNPENVAVNVDSSAVVLAAPGATSAIPVEVKGTLARSVRVQIEKALRERYSPVMTFKDVKVADNGQTLSYKLANKSYNLRRQN